MPLALCFLYSHRTGLPTGGFRVGQVAQVDEVHGIIGVDRQRNKKLTGPHPIAAAQFSFDHTPAGFYLYGITLF